MPNTIWDVLDSHPDIAISGAGLIATSGTVNEIKGSRCIDGKTSGKYYVEITVGGTTTGNCCIALTTKGYNWAQVRDNNLGGLICYANATIRFNGSNTGVSIGGFASGDIISIAADFSGHLAWIRKNGGNWNNSGTADPATGVGGFNISALSGDPWLLHVAPNNSVVTTFTLNSGDTTFSYTVPSGYTAGWTDNGGRTMGTTFNPADMTSGMTLSNSNLTVSTLTTGNRLVRTIDALPNDKRFFEIYINRGGSFTIGLARLSASPVAFLSNGTDGAVYKSAPPSLGNVYVDGSSQAAPGAANAGYRLAVAVDRPNNLIWFSVGSGWNNSGTANPATGVGGFSISSLAGDLFAAAATAVDSMTMSLNSSSQTKLTPPSGFTVGIPAAVVSPILQTAVNVN